MIESTHELPPMDALMNRVARLLKENNRVRAQRDELIALCNNLLYRKDISMNVATMINDSLTSCKEVN